jgi:hypothetical protein
LACVSVLGTNRHTIPLLVCVAPSYHAWVSLNLHTHIYKARKNA